MRKFAAGEWPILEEDDDIEQIRSSAKQEEKSRIYNLPIDRNV